MELPPGPLYLARLLPFLVVPSAITFLSLIFLQQQSTNIPNWLLILLTVLARPLLTIFQRYYTRYIDRRAAAANNAFIVPHVEEKRPNFAGISITKTLLNDFDNGHPGDAISGWCETYGSTFQLRLVADNRIITTEPDHVKAILATQFDAFEKGPVFRDQAHAFLGTGIFSADGDMWKFHRTMTRPFFTRDRISHFDIFDEHAEHALKQAAVRLADGHSIDFQDLVSRFTLDSATQFLFGHNVDSLSAGLPYPERSPLANSPNFLNHPSNVYVDAFVAGQLRVAVRSRLGPTWPLLEFWSDKIKPLRTIMDKFTEPLLVEALKKRESRSTEKGSEVKDTSEDGDTLLSHLVNRTQDPTVLKDELINLLVAGRDTTAATLTYSFYMLAENPGIAQKLRQEVLHKVGPTNRPTYDDMRELKYLRAFINEVLRLYPPVPFNGRTSTKPTILSTKTPGSKPYYVPANTKIIYSIFNMHRRVDLWGPDALEFDPERFLDERVQKYLTPNPYIFCPFNAGPRICVGQQFAYHESSFFLVRLLQKFSKFTLAPDAQPEESKPPAQWAECGGRKSGEKIWPASHLTIYVKGGLWVRMEEQVLG